jgi:hypothetical protein
VGLVIGSREVSSAEFEGEVVRLVHSYLHHSEALKRLQDRYGVGSPEDIEKKIAEGKLPEHPTYEDYLEALAHIDTMKSSLEDLRRILGALEMELPT